EALHAARAGGAPARHPAPPAAAARRRAAVGERARDVAREAPRRVARALARADRHRVQRARGADAQRRPRGEQEGAFGAGARPPDGALRPQRGRPPEQRAPEARPRLGAHSYRARHRLSPGEGLSRVGRLFWKIFFAFWLALVAAAAGSGAAVWWHRYARESAEPQLAVGPPQMFATDMAAATLRHGGVAALREWMEETGRVRRVRVFAVDAAGSDLLGRAVPEGALSRARELAAESGHPRAAQVVAAPGGESYLLFVPHTALAPPPPPLPVSPWMLIVIGAATSLAVSAILAWYLARPIRSLRWAFDAAAGGRLETRVSPLMGRRRDEIADLGRDFDRMALQLQKLVSAQRRLLHDVSHELRSPLARLQAAIGLARQEPAKVEPSLERIEREASRLDHMVGEVLALARLESGTATRPKERVDLAYLAANIAEDARFEAEAAGRGLRLPAGGDGPVTGHPGLA